MLGASIPLVELEVLLRTVYVGSDNLFQLLDIEASLGYLLIQSMFYLDGIGCHVNSDSCIDPFIVYSEDTALKLLPSEGQTVTISDYWGGHGFLFGFSKPARLDYDSIRAWLVFFIGKQLLPASLLF